MAPGSRDREESEPRLTPGVIEETMAPSLESSEPTLMPAETLLPSSESGNVAPTPPLPPTEPDLSSATLVPAKLARAAVIPSAPTPSVPTSLAPPESFEPLTPTEPTGATQIGATLEPGQVLFGKYLLVRKLGEGGMGEVWLVRHRDLDTERALKLIIASVAFNREMRARFKREAWAMARFTHPNAVTVHDAVIRPDGNAAYIEMEYVKGQSLNKVLKPGVAMPLDWTARIVVQLCAVLQLAHDQGIVHRDLKPSNLMLLDGQPPGQEHLKVLDFGLAKILGNEQQEETLVTRTGMTMGTPQYMSPEQISANPGEVGARCDIYAVGLILYEMLTGHRPFTSKLHKLIYDHMETPPPPFSAKNPALKVPPGVERLVLRCLEKDPARRPPSAQALAEAFLKAACLPDSTVVVPPRRPLRRTLLISLGLIAILAPAVTLLWPRTVTVPPGCAAVPGAERIRVGDLIYPRRIERVLTGGTRVPFLLIKKRRVAEPDTFYIMENKVWNGLFAQFARENPDAVKDSDYWRPIAEGQRPAGWNEQLPAMNMTAEQAHRCALWLGGKLPTSEQWDKASGLFDRGERVGPFEGPASPIGKTEIALNRTEDEGPLPVGTATKDIGPFDCRDMAGNGLEWTRSLTDPVITFPPPPATTALLLLRGHNYTEQEPLLYDELASKKMGVTGEYGEAKPYLGFRVVIELDIQ
jgi:serine/threonine protein kinase